jgi:hypothetical protein
MAGARPNLHIVRLQNGAALIGPIALQRQNQVLEVQEGYGGVYGHARSLNILWF